MTFKKSPLEDSMSTDMQGQDNETPLVTPGPLRTTVRIGLIVTDENFNLTCIIKAVKKNLNKIDGILSDTPHRYRFIIPYRPGSEHKILESLFADQVRKRCTETEIALIKHPYENDEKCPFNEKLPYITISFSLTDSTPGYDPVYDAVIDNSNIIFLIGEWEPKSAEYKKGSVFSLSRRYGRTIVSLDPQSGHTYEIPHEDRIFESYRDLNIFNTEKFSARSFQKNQSRYMKGIHEEAEKAGLDGKSLEPLYTTLLPHFTRTRVLMKMYKRYYRITGILVSLLAALAVATIAMQTIFFPEKPYLVWIEVAEIALIIVLMMGSRYGDYHRKWIDYNFLAERMRAAFFLCVICTTCEKPDTPPHMSIANRPNDWMVMAFEEMIKTVPLNYCRIDIPFEPLRKFFLSAWVNNRLGYYKKFSADAAKKYRILAIVGEFLFILTLILAVMHAFEVGHWEPYYDDRIPMSLAFLTISLPAIGSAIGAVRTQREYLRNAERYSHTVRHLSSIKNEINHASTIPELCNFLQEINELTLREQQDWRIIFRFRKIEAM
ncbi:hypothetical protein [Methanoplanus limicola]|uniref:SMODS and SLOG-associating 2TM effector domain-containing protein n=1 Tax=Methanoplanus limicola DSM 2279 TaxID=937775 RepID=H1Z2E1_9EURY|nr:hypothetical protein [Methanoplanus limicola]EHQ35467.1 hypothetical protein Metlim_1358 [Methanoplanus limicola DSM 2279]